MKLSQKRAETLALLALVVHVLFFLFTLWISATTNSLAVHVEAWCFLGGAGIWLILLIQFHQRRLAQEESLERRQYERLRQQGQDTSVFEGVAVEGSLDIAQRRLTWIEKYLISIFAVLIAGYLLGMGYWLFNGVRTTALYVLARHEVLLASSAYMAGMALISFLFSRYAVGMSRQSEWRPLRAGGSYMLSNALGCFALAIAIVVADAGHPMVEKVAAYVLAVLMLVIGIEIVLNLILDAYRPRIVSEYRRAAYESRILGLFSEPGGILRTTAHAIDYQFGFKVSETWFYKLLERAVLPLIVLNVIILYLMSCFAVISPGNVAVREVFGRPLNVDSPCHSGLHLKWPWPIERLQTFPVEQVQILDIGFERYEGQARRRPILWSVEHWKEELPFIVASSGDNAALSPDAKDTVKDDTPAADALPETPARTDFDLLVVALTVHYRIDDVAEYGYSDDHCYRNPDELIKAVCYRHVVLFAANRDIDTLLGPGRHVTTDTLRKTIQEQLDRGRLGVKVVFVGMETVHPPIDVAADFEKVVAALQERQRLVLAARGQAGEILARAQADAEELLARAEAYRFNREVLSRATAKRFDDQLYAYNKGGEVYLWREYLNVLDQQLASMRKFVFIGDNIDRWIYEMDLKEKLQPDLFEGLDIEENQQ